MRLVWAFPVREVKRKKDQKCKGIEHDVQQSEVAQPHEPILLKQYEPVLHSLLNRIAAGQNVIKISSTPTSTAPMAATPPSL
jgi:hypothetical protein